MNKDSFLLADWAIELQCEIYLDIAGGGWIQHHRVRVIGYFGRLELDVLAAFEDSKRFQKEVSELL